MAMTLRLTGEVDRALNLLATTQRCSKHEAVVRAIIAAATRTVDDARVREIAREHLAEYRRAERRLDQEQ